MSDAPVVLITGGSRGIGAAASRLAARQGWRVAVNYAANREAADAVVASITEGGGEAVAIQGDVGKAADIVSMFTAVDRHFGRLDMRRMASAAQSIEPVTLTRSMRSIRSTDISSTRCG